MTSGRACRCKPLLIATYNPDEGPLREHLLDRIAINLNADVPATFEQRVEAVKVAQDFQDNPSQMLEEAEELSEQLRTRVRLLHAPALSRPTEIGRAHV